jgi:hypothetical protein
LEHWKEMETPRVMFFLLFPEKEAKSVCSASQKVTSSPKLGEADPGGLGACPQETEPQLGEADPMESECAQ